MPSNNILYEVDYEPRFSLFHKLIRNRIKKILFVSSLYDRFLLEEDGRLSDQLVDDYLALNLSSPPQTYGVTSSQKGLDVLKKQEFDLIITMSRIGDMDPFSFAKKVKEITPKTPVALLLGNAMELQNLPLKSEQKGVDRIFLWTGDSKIFLAIIKLFEDELNVENDNKIGKIQVILLIENDIRYYSTFLPMLYEQVMHQTQKLIKSQDSLNEFHRILRMRARPKILLAENYDEGLKHFNKYNKSLLGILSDIAYPRSGFGDIDPNSGSDFIKMVKSYSSMIPTLLMSSRKENRKKADMFKSSFIYKHSPKAWHELKNFIVNNMGFGEFKFKLPNGKQIGKARNFEELKQQIQVVPKESLQYHAMNNHFSAWFMARGEFDLAYKIRPLTLADFKNDVELIRNFLISSIEELEFDTQSGVIVDYDSTTHNKSLKYNFSKIGGGSLGGKGRGLAFLYNLLSRTSIKKKYKSVKIQIPYSVVICTEEFDSFIEMNNLYDIYDPDISDEQVFDLCRKGRLSKRLQNDLKIFLEHIQTPIAVRSSSLLEDSQYQSMAGIYKTYILPNNQDSIRKRLHHLSTAIKMVYASMFLKDSKNFITNIGTKVEQEKMAVILQEVVGKPYNDKRFYPDFSGAAQSYNFYPFGEQTADDGIAYVSLGLGMVSKGIKSLRFCPKDPQNLPQFSTPDQILKNSQTKFIGINLRNYNLSFDSGEITTLDLYPLKVAEEDNVLYKVGATFDPESNAIRDGLSWPGPRVVNFAGVLKPPVKFPLAEIITDLLAIGQKAFGTPVDIEFAVNLASGKTPDKFFPLKIRPFTELWMNSQIAIEHPSNYRDVIAYSSQTLGYGIMKNIQNIVFVKPDMFNKLKTLEIAKEISKLNQKLKKELKNYLLIGYGRWGTQDFTLGIPVKWHDISEAAVIIESGLGDYNIDPSFGSHFFSKITELCIAYFTISPGSKNDYLNWKWLEQSKKLEETTFLSHIELLQPLEIIVDGKSRKGIIKIPEIQ